MPVIFIKLKSKLVQKKIAEYFKDNFDIQEYDSQLFSNDNLLIVEEELLEEVKGVNKSNIILLMLEFSKIHKKVSEYYASFNLPLEIAEIEISLKNFFNKKESQLKFGDIYLKCGLDSGELSYHQDKVLLSLKEALILKLLFQEFPNFIDKKVFLEKIWNIQNQDIETHILETSISNLRKKISQTSINLQIHKKKEGYILNIN